MANIKVPIGKRFEERERFLEDKFMAKSANTDLQFLKDLADQGKMVVRSGSSGSSGTIVTFTIPSGSTFYLMKTSFDGDFTNAILNFTNPTEQIDLFGATATNLPGKFQIEEGVALVGDGNRAIEIEGTGVGVSMSASFTGYISNSVTRSSRGTTSVT